MEIFLTDLKQLRIYTTNDYQGALYLLTYLIVQGKQVVKFFLIWFLCMTGKVPSPKVAGTFYRLASFDKSVNKKKDYYFGSRKKKSAF